MLGENPDRAVDHNLDSQGVKRRKSRVKREKLFSDDDSSGVDVGELESTITIKEYIVNLIIQVSNKLFGEKKIKIQEKRKKIEKINDFLFICEVVYQSIFKLSIDLVDPPVKVKEKGIYNQYALVVQRYLSDSTEVDKEQEKNDAAGAQEQIRPKKLSFVRRERTPSDQAIEYRYNEMSDFFEELSASEEESAPEIDRNMYKSRTETFGEYEKRKDTEWYSPSYIFYKLKQEGYTCRTLFLFEKRSYIRTAVITFFSLR
ncbi:hypothetical protein AX774_g5543 [Zancudomyces culisetae]|uniref:Uncharacterized protein n=1 Tax=Zancudomyces culisetae TaxID=1213189 RepID=A0A1R1PJ69_ZANCU|nr:hypothetical protein AX774_g5543 [Zancudomyces culisetae]|eukprot:OMH81006.1 hypothetical protein AX774_g5543 [Zancudomyces culisetae]